MVNGNKGNPPSVDGNEYKEDEKRKPEKKENLSEEFYSRLLGLPSCKIYGICDNCGKCDH